MEKQKILFNKTLIIGVIILFIGATVTPSISGYNKKTNIQSTREVPDSSPLNDDFINSYWKFNECSGSTLGDSSGHNYDGTIYGATWTTSGYSGCALDFDGVDDYVDLTSYAAEIMFNKTDDIILSFHFKSTNGGLIFSATALWGNNPEFRIELLSNGSLLFYKITQMCGIILYSTGTYNDGDWHHAEYYFNGITSNPTVTLYVDGNFDNNMTHWLCEIENDDYAKTKIGMHAHSSTDYYDGVLDEFKIIKYEQGNKQEPPTIDGPTFGYSDVEYDYTFITEDPEGDNISIYIDWDDGTQTGWIGPNVSGEEVIVSHKWDEDGKYNITAKSKDIWHYSRWSEKYVVRIGNQPPDPPTINGTKCGDPGVVYTYTFVSVDFDGDDVQYFINWGDGDTEWTDYYSSGEEVTVSHSWTSAGDYDIEVKAKDEHNNEGEWSIYLVRIGNQPPTAPTIDGQTSGKPGIEYEYTFNSTDPEGDPVMYIIEWGDNNTEWTEYGDSGVEIMLKHNWSEKGNYTIKAKAVDIYDAESNWTYYDVEIEILRNIATIGSLFHLFFDRFPFLEVFLRAMNLLR